MSALSYPNKKQQNTVITTITSAEEKTQHSLLNNVLLNLICLKQITFQPWSRPSFFLQGWVLHLFFSWDELFTWFEYLFLTIIKKITTGKFNHLVSLTHSGLYHRSTVNLHKLSKHSQMLFRQQYFYGWLVYHTCSVTNKLWLSMIINKDYHMGYIHPWHSCDAGLNLACNTSKYHFQSPL